MADIVAVTGAAGHIGSNLCIALLADGHRVRAIDLRYPLEACRHGARWVRADVRDEPAMRAAFENCDVVYHAAAVISVVGGLGGRVESVNVGGVGVVARAALDRGVRRLVHLSSIHAFDLAAVAGQPVDETAPRSVRPQLPVYDRSKAAGEVELLRVVERGLDAVIVNPSGVIGPIDPQPSRMGTVLRAIWRRWLPVLVEGGFDWVDVRDVVTALRAAQVRGRTGECYLLPGHRRSVVELARVAAAVRGTRVRSRVVRRRWLTPVAPVADVVARLTGTPLAPTREALHALTTFPTVDGSKAARELGHQPRPIEETLADLHDWFVETGRLPPAPAVTTRRDGSAADRGERPTAQPPARPPGPPAP